MIWNFEDQLKENGKRVLTDVDVRLNPVSSGKVYKSYNGSQEVITLSIDGGGGGGSSTAVWEGTRAEFEKEKGSILPETFAIITDEESGGSGKSILLVDELPTDDANKNVLYVVKSDTKNSVISQLYTTFEEDPDNWYRIPCGGNNGIGLIGSPLRVTDVGYQPTPNIGSPIGVIDNGINYFFIGDIVEVNE